MAGDDLRVPAGWYPDPLGLPQLRWWDNHAWTEHVSDARQPMVVQETVQQTAPRLGYADDEVDVAPEPSRRERRERERQAEAPGADGMAPVTAVDFADPHLVLEALQPLSLAAEEPSAAVRLAANGQLESAPTSAPFDLDARFNDLLGDPTLPRSALTHAGVSAASFVPSTATEPAWARRREGTSTRIPTGTAPVWVMTLIPLWMLVVGLLLLLANPHTDRSGLAIALLFGVPWVLGIVLAVIDYRMLERAGLERPAHWAWALLGALVYLVVRLTRTIRVAGTGIGPLLTFLVLGIVLIGAVVAVPGLIIQLSPATFSAEAQKVIVSDASTAGAQLKVKCPTVPPLLVQGTFTCRATEKGETTPFDITVSLQRANGWIDWRVDDWGVFARSLSAG